MSSLYSNVSARTSPIRMTVLAVGRNSVQLGITAPADEYRGSIMTTCLHGPGAVCANCSDQDPRWRGWRGGGDPPNEPPPPLYRIVGSRVLQAEMQSERAKRWWAAHPQSRIKPCLIEGCGRPGHAKGLCNMHYRQARAASGVPCGPP